MKYYSRLGLYKAPNVTFNPKTKQAYSYRWWRFVDVINGAVVFNEYRYSNSTSGHQSKVRRTMEALGIKIDLYVSVPSGLDGNLRYGQTCDVGRAALTAAYSRQDLANAARISKVFGVRFSQAEIQAIYDWAEEKLCTDYLARAYKYAKAKDAIEPGGAA